MGHWAVRPAGVSEWDHFGIYLICIQYLVSNKTAGASLWHQPRGKSELFVRVTDKVQPAEVRGCLVLSRLSRRDYILVDLDGAELDCKTRISLCRSFTESRLE